MNDKLPIYRSREFYSEIGKKGGRRRVEIHGIEEMRIIGKRGGQRAKELNAKGKLYEQQNDGGDSTLPATD